MLTAVCSLVPLLRSPCASAPRQTEYREPELQAELLYDPRAEPRLELKRMSQELCATYAELLGCVRLKPDPRRRSSRRRGRMGSDGNRMAWESGAFTPCHVLAAAGTWLGRRRATIER